MAIFRTIKAGSTSQLVDFPVYDSSSTVGALLTGLAYNTASLVAYYQLNSSASATAITLATATSGTYTSSGFVVKDATNMTGVYQLGIPNAALSSAGTLIIKLSGAANMVPVIIEIEIPTYDASGVVVTTNNDKTGYSLTQTFPTNFADLSISATTGLVDITQTAADKAWSTTTRVLTANTNLNDIAAADVWDLAISGHTTAGTTGEALSNASSAGDPWSTSLPGAYGAGTAGYIMGTNLDATVSSRLPTANISLSGGAVTVGTNNDKTGYSLTQTFPTNFADLAITATTGQVTVGTNNDKTGYSISGTKTTLDALNDLAQSDIRTATGLASANLDTQIGTLATTSHVDTLIGTPSIDVSTDIAAAKTSADNNGTSIAALNNISTTDVKTQVVAALNTDTYTESSGVPAATATLVDKISWLATLNRNKMTQTSTTKTLRNDADSGNIATSAVSDDGTTYTENEWI